MTCSMGDRPSSQPGEARSDSPQRAPERVDTSAEKDRQRQAFLASDAGREALRKDDQATKRLYESLTTAQTAITQGIEQALTAVDQNERDLKEPLRKKLIEFQQNRLRAILKNLDTLKDSETQAQAGCYEVALEQIQSGQAQLMQALDFNEVLGRHFDLQGLSEKSMVAINGLRRTLNDETPKITQAFAQKEEALQAFIASYRVDHAMGSAQPEGTPPSTPDARPEASPSLDQPLPQRPEAEQAAPAGTTQNAPAEAASSGGTPEAAPTGVSLSGIKATIAKEFPKELNVVVPTAEQDPEHKGPYVEYPFRGKARLHLSEVTTAEQIAQWKQNLDREARSDPNADLGKELAEAFRVGGFSAIIGVIGEILIKQFTPYLNKIFEKVSQRTYTFESVDKLLTEHFKIPEPDLDALKSLSMHKLVRFMQVSKKPNPDLSFLESEETEFLNRFKANDKSYKSFEKELLNGRNGKAADYANKTEDETTFEDYLKKVCAVKQGSRKGSIRWKS